jgi:dihydroorotate dehydrogenase
MWLIIRILRIFPPEIAHKISLTLLFFIHRLGLLSIFNNKRQTETIEFLGLRFKNTLGTAAGLDKNGDYIDCLGALGFGFLEVGTITPKAQAGNKKPRVFRLSKDQGVINRLGFNNKGIDHLVTNLKQHKYDGVIGVNIGANKNSHGKKRIEDYIECIRKVYKYTDYITVNISSPNTKNLRNLQNSENIDKLFVALENEIHTLKIDKPIFIKISPDESLDTIKYIINKVQNSKITGIIATNTTTDKSTLKDEKYWNYEGGLSGEPLREKSNDLIYEIRKVSEEIPLIGVGGVMSQKDYKEKLTLGADLVQIYTGFIMEGPGLIHKIINK